MTQGESKRLKMNADFLEYCYKRFWQQLGASEEHARIVARNISLGDRQGKLYQGMGVIEAVLIPFEEVEYSPLYRHPSKIWGIGLNYVEHAGDLTEKAPSVIPASFMKADTTIVGSGDEILIPVQSEKTTGEAELGVIFGKKCKNVEPENWLNVVAGFTPGVIASRVPQPVPAKVPSPAVAWHGPCRPA